MHRVGQCLVLLGLAAVGLIAVEAITTPGSAPVDRAMGREDMVAIRWLIGWAAFVGIVAGATLAGGIGDLVMSHRERNRVDPLRPPDGETAAMIDAEVNEGGPPSPEPCDTPAAAPASEKRRPSRSDFMSETPPTIETCPAPDRILHLPLGSAVGTARSTTLLKSDGLELIRLVLPAGKEIPPHRAAGEITVQCLEGHVAFEHDGRAIEMHAGDLLYLCPQETHALKGIADSTVLVTRVRPHADELPEKFPPS